MNNLIGTDKSRKEKEKNCGRKINESDGCKLCKLEREESGGHVSKMKIWREMLLAGFNLEGIFTVHQALDKNLFKFLGKMS